MTREQYRMTVRGLLQGKTPAQLARLKRLGLTVDEIRDVQHALQHAKILGGPPVVTPAQAAIALQVIPRRVRLLCQEGRLGMQAGRTWIITINELIEHLGRNHSSGQAGRQAAHEDRIAAESRYAATT